jgi:alginate O-acetyltransferase complex protein AlgI
MLFNSLTFVIFFALVLALYSLPLRWSNRKLVLLVASYLFYAAWNPPFVLLVWLSTLVDWFVARAIHAEQRTARRRLWLLITLAVNFGLLGYFKYGDFLLRNWQSLASVFGIEYQPPSWDIVLPVGISFYTFQTLAYTLDVYLRRAVPSRSLLDFALFVTFFPQLVAGPIVRPAHLLPQFATPRRAGPQQIAWGGGLMTVGLFQKVVVADSLLAPAADAVFGAARPLALTDAWLGTLAFSGQIFSDFAGYSTTAIGVAMCFGFSLPDNFRYPYAALGFSDFWRRWHISLSSWLRDYLYVPLGGNRKGRARTYINLIVTMLLGGLWHGASWTFVAWGGLHGVYLAAERWLRMRFPGVRASGALQAIVLVLFTYAMINVSWVFFRAPDFPTAWRMLGAMIGRYPDGIHVLPTSHVVQTATVVPIMLGIHGWMRNRRFEGVVARAPWWVVSLAWAAMLFLILTAQGAGDAFIYFQF